MGNGNTKQGTARPPLNSASVAFLVGTTGPPDGFLSQARRWVTQIVRAATAARGRVTAPMVQMADLGPDLTVVERTITSLSDAAKRATIAQIPDPKDPTRQIADPRARAVTDAVFAKHLGELKDHTLVFVTHGLEPPGGDDNSDGFVGPRDVREHGLLFHNAVKGFNAADTVLQVQHLQHMMLELTPPDPVIHVKANQERLDGLKPLASLDLTASDIAVLRRDVPRWVPVLEALRQSVFSRIYLAACGPKGRLTRFADLFQLAVHKDVYFNNARIFVTTTPQPFAEVGTEAPGGFILHNGKKYFTPDQVPLQTTPTSFLSGAEVLFAKNSKTR